MHALVISVGDDEAELAADRLWSLGVVAVEERTTSDVGRTELWTSLGEDTVSIAAALDSLPWPWRFEVIDESVSDTWRLHAEPTWIAPDLVVYPSWREHAGFAGAIAIGIDPGATFGMGDHPTTVLSMMALRAVVQHGDIVLDVGCGSGVLAIAACLFGAEHAVAIDISPAAVPTTRHNAQWNGVADRVDVSTTPLAEVDGRFAVVLANILAPALVELSVDLKRVVAPGGRLVISGILAEHERHEHVLAALQPMRQVARVDADGWTAITLTG